jgi:hypothetical protein
MTSRSSPLADMPRAEVAARVNTRARSPGELTQATLDRIAALAPKRHADDTVFAEEALAAITGHGMAFRWLSKTATNPPGRAAVRRGGGMTWPRRTAPW